MEKILTSVNKVNDSIGKVVCFLLIPLAIVTLTEVIARYVFDSPTVWAWDVNLQIFGCVILLGVGDALAKKRHVSIEALAEHVGHRTKITFELIGLALIMFVAFLLIWQGGIEARDSIMSRERLDTIWAPYIFPIKALLPVAGVLLLAQALANFIRVGAGLARGGKE